MQKTIIATQHDIAALVLRLTLGIVFLPHGAQKVLGAFGGHGFSGTMGYLTEQLQIPSIFAFLAIVAEFFGALGLIVGFLTRIAAFGIGCVMVVATIMVHYKFGFFMNWHGIQPGEGFEFHLLALGIAVAIMIRGGGAFSVDLLLSKNL